MIAAEFAQRRKCIPGKENRRTIHALKRCRDYFIIGSRPCSANFIQVSRGDQWLIGEQDDNGVRSVLQRGDACRDAGSDALRVIAVLPAILVVAFGILYFTQRGKAPEEL